MGSLSSISKPKTSTGNENKAKSKSKTKPAKSSIDSLFDTFESGNKIEDVIEKPPEAKIPEQPKSLMSSIFEAVKNKTGDQKVETSSEEDQGKMKITKVFDFAGESVE